MLPDIIGRDLEAAARKEGSDAGLPEDEIGVLVGDAKALAAATSSISLRTAERWLQKLGFEFSNKETKAIYGEWRLSSVRWPNVPRLI